MRPSLERSRSSPSGSCSMRYAAIYCRFQWWLPAREPFRATFLAQPVILCQEGTVARSGLSRRELLRRAGLAGTAILALPGVARIVGAGRDLAAQTRSLTAGSLATLRAVCARLIPTDENGPGATEAHAAEYIDRALRGALAPSRADYIQGLATIDRMAQQKFSGPFTKLSTEQQDAVLTDLQDTPFFAIVRGHTLQGTFCDPVYGGNAG